MTTGMRGRVLVAASLVGGGSSRDCQVGELSQMGQSRSTVALTTLRSNCNPLDAPFQVQEEKNNKWNPSDS